MPSAVRELTVNPSVSKVVEGVMVESEVSTIFSWFFRLFWTFLEDVLHLSTVLVFEMKHVLMWHVTHDLDKDKLNDSNVAVLNVQVLKNSFT